MNEICSLVIPTINRQDLVRGLVQSLKSQSYKEIEIVVVDQTTFPDALLAQDSSIVYVHKDVASTPLARNAGVEAAKGSIVLFLDDDVEIHDEYLVESLMDFFQKNPAYVGAALAIEDKNADLNRENQRMSNKVMSVTWSGRVLPYARGVEQDVQAPRGGGVAYRRPVIIGLGGFDSRYIGNAMREETDFSLRVVRSKSSIRFLPKLHIVHLALSRGGSRSTDRMRWYRDFFANELLFQLTHFSRLALPLFFMRKMRPILACMLWYGKGRPIGFTTPFKGFEDGIRRYKEGFHPYPFS